MIVYEVIFLCCLVKFSVIGQSTDTNDYTPMFERRVYDINVLEDIPVGSLLAMVTAFDLDSGANGLLEYSLAQTSGHDLFQVDAVSGLLSLSGGLDYERMSLISLTVKATDNGVPKRTGTAWVNVHVKDVNDNAPMASQREYHLQARVGTKKGTDLGTVQLIDYDMGPNGKVDLSISQSSTQDDPQIFAVSGFSIVTNVDLNSSHAGCHNLTLVATDRGQPPLSTHIPVTICVAKDFNRFTPMFGQMRYFYSVLENPPFGTIIGQVTATDPDSGVNGQIEYSLRDTSGHDDLFEIDAVSGMLSVSGYLDRENTQMIQLKVEAADKGDPRRTAIAAVTIFVQDVNDNAPIASQDVYQFQVAEGTKTGSVVGTVQVVDPDLGPNGKVDLSISIEDDPQIFAVSGFSIVTNVDLNSTHAGCHDLTLVATDRGQPPLSTEIYVTICVDSVTP